MTDAEQADQMFAELRRKIVEAYTAEFHARPGLAGGGAPQITFQVIFAGALIDVAAEIGTDAGMTESTFTRCAQESYSRCLHGAPKFG